MDEIINIVDVHSYDNREFIYTYLSDMYGNGDKVDMTLITLPYLLVPIELDIDNAIIFNRIIYETIAGYDISYIDEDEIEYIITNVRRDCIDNLKDHIELCMQYFTPNAYSIITMAINILEQYLRGGTIISWYNGMTCACAYM